MKPLISVVIPVLNEGDNIQPLLNRLLPVIEKYDDYEVIFVDDGSTDNTVEVIENLHQTNNKINHISFLNPSIITLSLSNFGFSFSFNLTDTIFSS